MKKSIFPTHTGLVLGKFFIISMVATTVVGMVAGCSAGGGTGSATATDTSSVNSSESSSATGETEIVIPNEDGSSSTVQVVEPSGEVEVTRTDQYTEAYTEYGSYVPLSVDGDTVKGNSYEYRILALNSAAEYINIMFDDISLVNSSFKTGGYSSDDLSTLLSSAPVSDSFLNTMIATVKTVDSQKNNVVNYLSARMLITPDLSEPVMQPEECTSGTDLANCRDNAPTISSVVFDSTSTLDTLSFTVNFTTELILANTSEGSINVETYNHSLHFTMELTTDTATSVDDTTFFYVVKTID